MKSTNSNLSFSFLLIRAAILLSPLATLKPSICPGLSFSVYVSGPGRNRGKLVESLRMRPRTLRPLLVACPFDVVVVGEAPILEESHICEPPGVRIPEAGLDCPLGVCRPGLDQPPPRAGEGLRDKDMGTLGVPAVRGGVSAWACRLILPRRKV